MNIFAHIERLEEFQFGKVKYFSILSESMDVNEFYDFLNRMEDIEAVEEDLNNLMVWIEEIGENYGAQKRFFRNESIITDTQALPPPRRQMNYHEITVEDLRLYCLALNEHVVFLFNGDIKTTNNAQDCPNVAPRIKQANHLAGIIDELLKSGEIRWNKDYTDLIFEPELEFEI